MSVSTFLLRIGVHYCALSLLVAFQCLHCYNCSSYWCNLLFVFAYIFNYLCQIQLLPMT
ncbi:uncharacterized protein V1513DRAFT_435371, partial [Lipomyces chichibuensis]|uniref:uncharacterized protein n=1 Tax=Lipomyces chichibuensis TaxID=1546026 RepID=UPI003343536E